MSHTDKCKNKKNENKKSESGLHTVELQTTVKSVITSWIAPQKQPL
jgi:hypothetical protein